MDRVHNNLVEAEVDQITSVLGLRQIQAQAMVDKARSTLVEARVVDMATSEVTTVASTPPAPAVRHRSTKTILSTAIVELARKLPRLMISSVSVRDHSRNHGPSATPLLAGKKLARRRGSERRSVRKRKRRRRNKPKKPKGRRRKTVRRGPKQKKPGGSRCVRGRGRLGSGRLVRRLRESGWRRKRQNWQKERREQREQRRRKGKEQKERKRRRGKEQRDWRDWRGKERKGQKGWREKGWRESKQRGKEQKRKKRKKR
jgi:hypothetical protein